MILYDFGYLEKRYIRWMIIIIIIYPSQIKVHILYCTYFYWGYIVNAGLQQCDISTFTWI